jgi:hypothetical protein
MAPHMKILKQIYKEYLKIRQEYSKHPHLSNERELYSVLDKELLIKLKMT